MTNPHFTALSTFHPGACSARPPTDPSLQANTSFQNPSATRSLSCRRVSYVTPVTTILLPTWKSRSCRLPTSDQLVSTTLSRANVVEFRTSRPSCHPCTRPKSHEIQTTLCRFLLKTELKVSSGLVRGLTS